MKKKVVLGMSGGVDSSVAAYLLKEEGYDVIGLFMKNWEEDSETCTAENDYLDVRNVCNLLDIPHYSINFSKQYYDRVFTYFIDEYKKGRTPNPDVLCNREIKFGPFLEYANKIGADYIATGHYCNVEHSKVYSYLKKAVDPNKCQTYFLNQLRQEQLQKVLFPVGNLIKPKVREIAEKLNLSTAKKKDSTGICFIGERNFRQFLSTYIPNQVGDIKTLDGKIVGQHKGCMYYTIGQRRGLDIGGVKGTEGRWFVISKDVQRNIIYVQQNEGGQLLSSGLVAKDFNFIPKLPDKTEFLATAKFRYRQPEQDVFVKIDGDSVYMTFKEPQRAITIGQFAVLYDGEYCLGGGVIEETKTINN